MQHGVALRTTTKLFVKTNDKTFVKKIKWTKDFYSKTGIFWYTKV